MSKLAAVIMKSRIHAAGIAGFFGGLSFYLGILSVLSTTLSSAAVGLVLMRKGAYEGGIVLVLGMLVIALLNLVGGVPATGALMVSVALAFTFWIPVGLCAWLLRVTQSQGLTLLCAGSLAATVAGGWHAYTGDVVGWWRNWTMQIIEQARNSGLEVRQLPPEEMFLWMNGVAASFYGLVLILSILLARWWQSQLYNPGGFGAEFRALRLPRWLVFPVVGLLLAGLTGIASVGGTFLADLLLIGVVLYMIQGLAALHAISHLRSGKRWWLFAIYFGFLALTVPTVTCLALLGVVDTFLNVRPKRTGTDASK